MNTFSSTTRNHGVLVPDPVDNVNAPSKTVTNVARVQLFAVEFGDDEGRKHTTTIMKVGDQYYRDPAGEEWTKRLIRLPETSWFHQQLTKMIAEKSAASSDPEPLPSTDDVDVMGSAR